MVLQFGKMTPENSLALLGTMQPTSKFGELFQYSNLMAAAAGYTGAHVLYPANGSWRGVRPCDAVVRFRSAGDERDNVRFCSRTRRQSCIAARAGCGWETRESDDGGQLRSHTRPPGSAAWSSVRDMLKYVSMELAEGKLPDGKVYISKEPLLGGAPLKFQSAKTRATAWA